MYIYIYIYISVCRRRPRQDLFAAPVASVSRGRERDRDSSRLRSGPPGKIAALPRPLRASPWLGHWPLIPCQALPRELAPGISAMSWSYASHAMCGCMMPHWVCLGQGLSWSGSVFPHMPPRANIPRASEARGHCGRLGP